MSNKFIVFEGIDGSGKTTLAKMLSDYLFTRKDGAVLHTQEPTDSVLGLRIIRGILNGSIEAKPYEIASLFATDRIQHLYRENGIIPWLSGGGYVVCDRYILSSIVYQGYNYNIIDYVNFLNREFIRPGVTFYINVDVDTAMERICVRDDVSIFETKDKLKAIKGYYEKAIELSDHNVYRIDGNCSIDDTFDQIKNIIGAEYE